MTTDLIEVNFDGLVGPSHHYGGLGVGNLASLEHQGRASNPQAAALQGIDKIKAVVELADPSRVRAAVLPPQARPNIDWLRRMGFTGGDADVLVSAQQHAPRLLQAAWSASAMWTANAATVSPSKDCLNHRLQLTVANLSSSMHRSLEPAETFKTLSGIFADDAFFCVHRELPGGHSMRDEGAANHMRLGSDSLGDSQSIELFVYGESSNSDNQQANIRFMARQSEQACRAIARLHQLPEANTFFLQQHPEAIAAGAFHNDVVATSCENVMLYHERAFFQAHPMLQQISTRYRDLFGKPLHLIEIPESQMSLQEAVKSYLFNSQLILNRSGGMTLLCPSQCRDMPSVMRVIEDVLNHENPVSDVGFVELRESMWNGGGPACLRLRVPVTACELQHISAGVIWSDQLEQKLVSCIRERYRDRVTAADLADIGFAQECWETTWTIRRLLGLPLA